MHERLPAHQIDDHHVQETVAFIDAGAPLMEFYCCRCQTIKIDIEWFQDHDCTD